MKASQQECCPLLIHRLLSTDIAVLADMAIPFGADGCKISSEDVLGGKVIGPALACELILTFLAAHLTGAPRHKCHAFYCCCLLRQTDRAALAQLSRRRRVRRTAEQDQPKTILGISCRFGYRPAPPTFRRQSLCLSTSTRSIQR